MNIIIDGKLCEAEYGEYLLEVAGRNDIFIPALCHNAALPGQASCRLCVVEVIENGIRKTVSSCVYPVTKEIEVITDSEKLMKMRRTLIMLLALRVPENEYIKVLKEKYLVNYMGRFRLDADEQCIMCGLCVKACEAVGQHAISTVNRGITKRISTPYDEPSTSCIGCGACAAVCPTKAIKVMEEDGRRTIWNKTFELMKCTSCGKYFITREQLAYMNKKLGTDADTLLCEDCRKNAAAERMKDIYKGL